MLTLIFNLCVPDRPPQIKSVSSLNIAICLIDILKLLIMLFFITTILMLIPDLGMHGEGFGHCTIYGYWRSFDRFIHVDCFSVDWACFRDGGLKACAAGLAYKHRLSLARNFIQSQLPIYCIYNYLNIVFRCQFENSKWWQ